MQSEYVKQLVKDGIATGLLGGGETIDVVRQTVQLRRDPLMLDVGAAGGSMALALSDIFGGTTITIDKDADMATSTASRVGSFSYKGDIRVYTIDVFDTALNSRGPFDLVGFRGFQSFVSNPVDLAQRVYSLLKPWGYLVNVTQTYEREADKAVIEEINKRIGSYIKDDSVSDVSQAYLDAGFRPVLVHQLPQAAVEAKCTVLSDPELAELFAKNDAVTSAYVMIFRKPSAIETLTNDICKN